MANLTERAELTERQQEAYEFIVNYTKEHLYPPSFEEISDNTHISGKSEAKRICGILAKKGYIEITPRAPRRITLVGYKLVKVESSNE